MMHKYNQIKEVFFKENSEYIESRSMIIPFENFVVNPWKYIEQIEKILGVCSTKHTKVALSRMNIPRHNTIRNIQHLDVDELIKNNVKQVFIKEYFYDLCDKYENKFFT